MSKITLQELNGLSPRARKAHEDSNVISEILTENPNATKEFEIDLFDEIKDEPKKTKKGKKNEKL